MPLPIIFHHFHSPKVQNFRELEPNRRICFFQKMSFCSDPFLAILGQFSHLFWPFWPKLLKNVPNLTISLQKSRKKLEKIGKCPKTYPKPKMVPKMGEDGQIWLKCITGDLIMIRDKNNIFERVEIFHADSAWNYPPFSS